MVVWLTGCAGAGALLALSSLLRPGFGGPKRLRMLRRTAAPLLLAPGAWLGMGLSLYGAFGLVQLAFAPALGILWAPAAAVALTLPVAALVESYLRSESSSMIPSMGDDPYIAEVTTAIPEHGVGAVSFVANGRRIFRPAASSEGRAISRGASVLVISLRRDIVVVEALAQQGARKGRHA